MNARWRIVRRIPWLLLVGGLLLLLRAIVIFARGSFLFADYPFDSLAA